MDKRKIIVTSALPYANGALHLGHLVEYLQTDFWARYQRMMGHEVVYVCADDTHGTPIMIRARKEGITPEALIARSYEARVREFGAFEMGFDRYGSTNCEENRILSESIYLKLKERGLISSRSVDQLYCERCGMFLPDRSAARPTATATIARSAAPPTTLPTCGSRAAPSAAARPSCARASSSSWSWSLAGSSSRAGCPSTPTRARRRNCWSGSTSRCAGGTSRGTRLTSASVSRATTTSISTCGWTRPWAIWPPSGPGPRRAGRRWRIGGRTRRPRSTTSSARTSCASTASSGPRSCRRRGGARPRRSSSTAF